MTSSCRRREDCDWSTRFLEEKGKGVWSRDVGDEESKMEGSAVPYQVSFVTSANTYGYSQ